MNADSILKALADQYAAAQTYQDSGTLLSIIEAGDESRQIQIEFSTSFRRPNSLSFEWTTVGRGSYRLWFNNEQIFISTPSAGTRRPKNLGQTVATASSMSGGAVNWIIYLLLPQLGGRNLCNILNPVLIENVKQDDPASAYLIAGTWDHPNDLTVRIDSRLAITSIVSKHVVGQQDAKQNWNRGMEMAGKAGTPMPAEFPSEDFVFWDELRFDNIIFDKEIPDSAFD